MFVFVLVDVYCVACSERARKCAEDFSDMFLQFMGTLLGNYININKLLRLLLY